MKSSKNQIINRNRIHSKNNSLSLNKDGINSFSRGKLPTENKGFVMVKPVHISSSVGLNFNKQILKNPKRILRSMNVSKLGNKDEESFSDEVVEIKEESLSPLRYMTNQNSPQRNVENKDDLKPFESINNTMNFSNFSYSKPRATINTRISHQIKSKKPLKLKLNKREFIGKILNKN